MIGAKERTRQPAHNEAISTEFQRATAALGLKEFTHDEAKTLSTKIVNRLLIGLQRTTDPVLVAGGMANDGGFACFRTGVPLIPRDIWQNVAKGTHSYVVSVGGTNSKFFEATKVSDEKIDLNPLGDPIVYERDREKQLTFAAFVERIIDPVAHAYRQDGRTDRLRLGISLAFPHKNIPTDDGVDAEFTPLEADGTLPKGWKITDWPQLVPEKRSFIATLKERAKVLGINPDLLDIVILNDTPATALDSTAAQKANNLGIEVLHIGGVGGTGTNFATDKDRLINTEIGRFPIKADLVTKRMLENIASDNDEPEMRPELEHLTGGKYAPERLRAVVQLLGEQHQLVDARHLAAWIRGEQEINQTLVSDLASGKIFINPSLQYLSQLILKKAGQAFGIATAAVVEATYGKKEDPLPVGVLIEGSFVNVGYHIKQTVEDTAAKLGHPLTIIEADSNKGIGALVMSFSSLKER